VSTGDRPWPAGAAAGAAAGVADELVPIVRRCQSGVAGNSVGFEGAFDVSHCNSMGYVEVMKLLLERSFL